MQSNSLGGKRMNIFKKLFSKKNKSKDVSEKKPEAWYNDAHEKGEVAKEGFPYGTGGSESIFMAISNR